MAHFVWFIVQSPQQRSRSSGAIRKDFCRDCGGKDWSFIWSFVGGSQGYGAGQRYFWGNDCGEWFFCGERARIVGLPPKRLMKLLERE